MFQNEERSHYEKNQIVNVICQLRFPTILSIGATDPYEFQDAVRKEFPRYEKRREPQPPKLVNRNGVMTQEPQAEVINHTFLSVSGDWTLNLTSDFIALSAGAYADWETFGHKLDRILAEFLRIYEPAFIERVGLRYINGFSREELGVEELRWNDLLQSAYVGLLDEDDVQDGDFTRCTQDAEVKARGGCRAKLHLGPGMIKKNGVQETKPRFIYDIDVSMTGQLPPAQLTGALQTAHLNAVNLFEAALTDALREAMEPQ